MFDRFEKFFYGLFAVGLVLAALQAWYYFTHCTSVKWTEMNGLCALLLYTAK